MHEYMTRPMVALKSFTYADWPLEIGDDFMATPDDVRSLERSGKAKPGAPQSELLVPAGVSVVAAAATLPPAAAPAAVETAAQPAQAAEPAADSQAELTPDSAAEEAVAAAAPESRRRGRPTNAEKLARQAAETGADSPAPSAP